MGLSSHQLNRIFAENHHHIVKAVKHFRPEVSGVTADDVEQEVGIRLIKLFQSDRKIENLSSYIYKITANVIIDLARKNQKYHSDVELENSSEDDSSHFTENKSYKPDQNLQNKELIEQVMDVIETLPKDRRVAVKLRLQGFSVKEMSEMTGWPFYKAENLSKRAMSALKTKLKQLGIEYDYQTDE